MKRKDIQMQDQKAQNPKINNKELIMHSFEAGRRGKPDEFESQIANLLAAEILEIDTNARFDLRVNGGFSAKDNKPFLRMNGEVSENILETPGLLDQFKKVILGHYKKIYRTEDLNENHIYFDFTPQAVNLAQNSAAGDSGVAIAVAYADTPNYLPIERYLAVEIRDKLDEVYLNGNAPGLKADGKIEVSSLYDGAHLARLFDVTAAIEHQESASLTQVQETLEQVSMDALYKVTKKTNYDLRTPQIVLANTGKWTQGGWQADAGTREAKPYRDGFSSYGVCEDSFSGEDPTKPSMTATVLARQIAVSIVSAGIAKFARVTLGYRIGQEEPFVNIFTFGTSKMPQEELQKLIDDKLDLRISATIERLKLRDSKLYRTIAENSDYFHSKEYLWNNPLSVF